MTQDGNPVVFIVRFEVSWLSLSKHANFFLVIVYLGRRIYHFLLRFVSCFTQSTKHNYC
jgi:hypothetical protein